MDLSTEIGIQNFRRALHLAFKDVSGKIDQRQFIKRDGSVDVQAMIMSVVDKVGLNTLQIIRAINDKQIKPTPPPTSSGINKKVNESFGCGHIKQILDDETDE